MLLFVLRTMGVNIITLIIVLILLFVLNVCLLWLPLWKSIRKILRKIHPFNYLVCLRSMKRPLCSLHWRGDLFSLLAATEGVDGGYSPHHLQSQPEGWRCEKIYLGNFKSAWFPQVTQPQYLLDILGLSDRF